MKDLQAESRWKGSAVPKKLAGSLVLLAFGLLFCTATTFGDTWVWVENLTVKGVHAGHGADDFYIYTVEPGPAGCNNSRTWYYSDPNETQRNRAYSAALLAFAIGQKVKLFTDNICVNGFNNLKSVIVGSW